jgi:hypothetical protein
MFSRVRIRERNRNGACGAGGFKAAERRLAGVQEIASLGQAEVGELIVAFGDYLIVVDPDVAVTSEDVYVRFRFPVGVGLAAVGVAKGDVDAGKFFVLQKDANHRG